MDIEEDGRILSLTGIRELNKAAAAEFVAAVRSVAKSRVQAIEVDLSDIKALDSAGLAALIALRKAVDAKAWIEKPAIRLREPQPAVQQILELTRLHHLFEIVPRYAAPFATAASPSAGAPIAQPA